MAEKQEANKEQAKPANKIVNIDTTSQAIRKAYLEPIGERLEKSFHAGEVLRMAAIAIAADSIGLTGEDRKAFFRQMDSLPGWILGGNNSACRQAFEKKGGLETLKDYADF